MIKVGSEHLHADMNKLINNEPLGNSLLALMAADDIVRLHIPRSPGKTTSTVRCPNCNRYLANIGHRRYDMDYCPRCGQAIKWNE